MREGSKRIGEDPLGEVIIEVGLQASSASRVESHGGVDARGGSPPSSHLLCVTLGSRRDGIIVDDSS